MSKKSMGKCIPESKLYMGSKLINYHTNSHSNLFRWHKWKILAYLRNDMNSISLDEFIIMSQFMQAETYKYAIEHFRRRKYSCSGSLFWKYADAWPESGDTIVDYYLDKKPSYYYVKKAYAPVLVSIKREEYGVSVWVVNDTLESFEGELQCMLQEFKGGVIKSISKKVKIKSNCSEKILMDRVEPFGKTCFYYAKLAVGNKVISQNRMFFSKYKELYIPEVKLDCSLNKTGKSRYSMKIRSDYFALMVRLELPDDVSPSDNYFDILAGQTKEVILNTSRNLKKNSLKVHTLNEYLAGKTKFFT